MVSACKQADNQAEFCRGLVGDIGLHWVHTCHDAECDAQAFCCFRSPGLAVIPPQGAVKQLDAVCLPSLPAIYPRLRCCILSFARERDAPVDSTTMCSIQQSKGLAGFAKG